jgi:two-component system nitrogen regulation response regulator GlnG
MAKAALLVEDDAAIAMVITAALQAEGFEVARSDSIAGRDRLLAERSFDVMLTDVVLVDGDGIETLGTVQRVHPTMPIIILSAQNTLDTAVRATGTGAFEYFPKPFDLDELVRAARQAAGRVGDSGTEQAEVGEGLPLIGRSPPMQDVYRMITRVLGNDLSVLILGESGTGKELVAEAIHQLGHRKAGPFVAVNTAAIPRELIESELFGHEKGGTLFLDEIGDMPPEAQTRLLRALQSSTIRRVGGREEIAVDVRIVAATNRDLVPMIAEGTFREDLFYRLNVVPIRLPPLRDRSADVEPLARHFLRLAAAEGLPPRRLTSEALDLLTRQPWRGNVRELKNLVYRAALLAREDTIDAASVAALLEPAPSGEGAAPADLAAAVRAWVETARPSEGALYHTALAAFERPLFELALGRTAGNQLRTARLLGINRNTLRKRLSELGIDPDGFAPRG